jgi:drug/metabolite transporter (DMT)-like permease
MSTDAVLLLELVALRWVSSVDAAIVYTTEPVLGAIIAWFVLGERFGPKGFLGAAIIIVAALTTQLVGVQEGGEDGK